MRLWPWKRNSENCPYESWSRKDYREAYEEANNLLKQVVVERNGLREKIRRIQALANEQKPC